MTGCFRTAISSLASLLICVGCASTGPETELENLDYKSRAATSSDGTVTVSASGLSADESRVVYGVGLAKKGIQPVWVEVENGDDVAYWLMSPGLDPNFFPASEAVDAFTLAQAGETVAVLAEHFDALAFRNPIPPGAKVSGFVLTNLDEGVKMIQVDLVASDYHKSFSFLSSIPGFRADYHARGIFRSELYTEDEITDHTSDCALRAALQELPCCVTNKGATRNGDPLNLVIVGKVNDILPALVRRGWHPTEQTWFGSVTKMISSALSGERYPYAPVSPLYLYDRPQDFALQKSRNNIHQRNHLRLWLSPIRYRGEPVWVGQISRDIGTRFTIQSKYLTTHKIDPDVDEARTALQEDMVYSQSLAKLGMVKGVGTAPRNAPRHNLTKDPYYTDGLRAVLFFDVHPTAITDIHFLPWEGREGGFIEYSVNTQRK